MNYFPVFLNVQGKPCVVVGGGSIGSRKASALVEAGAAVTVVGPKIEKSLLHHVTEGTVRHVRRHYQTGDLKGCLLAYAATGLAEVDEAMMAEAQSEGVLINVVDRSSMCDFIAPAVVRRGDITLAVSTNGKSPGLAKLIRRKLERVVTPAYAEVLSVVADKRRELKQSVSSPHERKRLLREFTESRNYYKRSEGFRQESSSFRAPAQRSQNTDDYDLLEGCPVETASPDRFCAALYQGRCLTY